MGRLGRADEVAAVAVYLASDESAFTTGTLVDVDGGMSIQALAVGHSGTVRYGRASPIHSFLGREPPAYRLGTHRA